LRHPDSPARIPVLRLLIVSLAIVCAFMAQQRAEGGPPIGFLITVNSTSDADSAVDGVCTFREAIIASNGTGHHECPGSVNHDGIEFELGPGNPVIDVLTELPEITQSVTVMGAGTATRVVLHGPSTGTPVSGFHGLTITGNDVRGSRDDHRQLHRHGRHGYHSRT
jgi:CSLREA domain-containing protein